jgi:hypothetical protein
MVSADLDRRGREAMQKIQDQENKGRQQDMKIAPFLVGAVMGAGTFIGTDGNAGAAAIAAYGGYEETKSAIKKFTEVAGDIKKDVHTPGPHKDIPGDGSLPSIPEDPKKPPAIPGIDNQYPININVYGGQGAGLSGRTHEPPNRGRRPKSHKSHAHKRK